MVSVELKFEQQARYSVPPVKLHTGFHYPHPVINNQGLRLNN
jgi:hypothetical protein